MTTTDRELMEAAAKAAGIKVGWRESVGCLCYSGSPYHVAWNPLTDDGDALRLAVALRLNVEAGWVVWNPPDAPYRDFCEPNGGDIFAATRRAIVRAAAAMASA